jgi:uncharacterized LabA/DUF88 family protein
MDRLAVLIDADNSMPGVIDELLKETTKYGRPIIKRAYGDWTTPHLQSWKKVLHKHAIMPRQQFNYTIGKNSTDCALIIDAMDLLYSKNLTGFCIVSSDSDFTGLATRIRQDGLSVYGFGERKTPGAFVAACDKFIFLEVLKCTHGENQPPTETADHKSTDFCGTIAEAINVVARDDGWATLAAVGDHISKNDPSFDPRNFGYRKLGELVAAVEFVETKYEEIGEHKHMYVKLKELKP